METNELAPLLDDPQNDKEFTEIATQVRRIGRQWVAKATGYNEQSITDFINNKSGSKKLKLSIIANLGNALRLREAAQREEIDQAWQSLRDCMESMTKI